MCVLRVVLYLRKKSSRAENDTQKLRFVRFGILENEQIVTSHITIRAIIRRDRVLIE